MDEFEMILRDIIARFQESELFISTTSGLSEENALLLKAFRSSYKVGVFDSIIECHLMSNVELARHIAKYYNIDFYDERPEDVKPCRKILDLPTQMQVRAVVCECSNIKKLLFVDPWDEKLSGILKQNSDLLDLEVGVISHDIFSELISEQLRVDEKLNSTGVKS